MNLEPLYQFYSKRQAGSSVAAALGFDFGLLYAANESLRLGIHFKEPYTYCFGVLSNFSLETLHSLPQHRV
ncbi:MAG: hypothetical protein FJ218_03940 [Ignavibacteria bacterium]|nr:hypothetical protein [Ignavibacteria bacterium]